MRKSPPTLDVIPKDWLPAKQSPVGDLALNRLTAYMPPDWFPRSRRNGTPRPFGDFFIHPQFNMTEDGNGTAYVALVDHERELVFIWFYFNF